MKAMKKYLVIICSTFLLILVLDYADAFPNLEKKYLAFRYGTMLNSIRIKNNLPPVSMDMLRVKDDDAFLSQIRVGNYAEIYFDGWSYKKYNAWLEKNSKRANENYCTIGNYYFFVSYWGNLQLLKDSLFESQWQFLVENGKVDSFLLKENIEFPLTFTSTTISLKWHRFLFKVKRNQEQLHFLYPLSDTLAISSNLFTICNSLVWRYNLEKEEEKIITYDISLQTPIPTLPFGMFRWYSIGMYEYISINEKTKDSLLQVWKAAGADLQCPLHN